MSKKFDINDPARMFQLQRGANLERKAMRRKINALLNDSAYADGSIDAVEALLMLKDFLDSREKRTRQRKLGL